MPSHVQAGQVLRTLGQADLVLKAAVGLAEVMQEGDGRQPLDQPPVAKRQARPQQQPLTQQRGLEQRLDRCGDVGAVIDERMPFELRRLVTKPAKLPPSSLWQSKVPA
jgi:hypothetical protein